MTFDPSEFRNSFPQLELQQNGNTLVYFDNGASTLKHIKVIEREKEYNSFEVANVHRGSHQLSRLGTESYELARKQVASFIGAEHSEEIIFTRGTTESINLVAASLGQTLQVGDEILLTPFEHHSNIVPWQVLCEQKNLNLKVIPFSLDMNEFQENFRTSLSERTKVCAFLHYSNSLGHRLPIETMIAACREHEIITLVDGAQALLTEELDLRQLNCDFYCFSGHKVFAPYGIGALYGRKSLLEALPPYQTGGSMIDRVSFEKTTYADIPQRFEAGTPNVSGAIALAEALKIIKSDGVSAYHKHVFSLRERLIGHLKDMKNIHLHLATAEHHCGVVSFSYEGAHPADLGTLLDKYAIAVRAGHHCTQPLMAALGVSGTLRVSLAPYNTLEEVDYFVNTLNKLEEFF